MLHGLVRFIVVFVISMVSHNEYSVYECRHPILFHHKILCVRTGCVDMSSVLEVLMKRRRLGVTLVFDQI